MSDTLLLLIVVGVLMLAAVAYVAAAIGWARRRARGISE